MAEVTQQQVVDYIKGISVLELSQLVKTLESELGVSAAAAMPVFAGAAPGAAGGGAGGPGREKTQGTGARAGGGTHKNHRSKNLRARTPPRLEGAKDPVEWAPPPRPGTHT